jgi:hypothetical protein
MMKWRGVVFHEPAHGFADGGFAEVEGPDGFHGVVGWGPSFVQVVECRSRGVRLAKVRLRAKMKFFAASGP